jgi:hypothetical protein
MPYDAAEELKKVRDYYRGDPLQKRFSALVTGETNAGKTFLLRSARLPIHIDSFDPGGTKCLRDMIEKGDVVADTRWENDDPFNPTAFAEWMKAIELRFHLNYFDQFGTYCLDSATMFDEAAMAYQLNSRSHAGEAPQRNKDYMPVKTNMINYIRKLMNLPCDFILTGHLKEIRKVLRIDEKTGIVHDEIKYRFLTIGQASVTIPLLFDELYVIVGSEGRDGPKREMLIDSLGTYVARSRLKREGLLDAIEPPNIKAILKKSGFSTDDKPKLPKFV